jgi:superfamily II DNA or RNA helicase
MEFLAIQRARLQNNSKAKISWVENNINNYSDLKFTLFYAGDMIFNDLKRILGYDKGISLHEFTGKQSRMKRKELLNKFSQGELKALIAMKCLDEGVDIPPTRTAYFLASSGNPREFIQRRGRVLRKFPGKESAKLYDIISIPPMDYINKEIESRSESYNAVRSAFKKEYKRIKEFSKLAINSSTSLNDMFLIADKLDLIGV